MFDFLIVCFAVWRLTNIVHEEKIFESVRARIGYDGLAYPDTFLGNLFACFYCLSVWIAILCCVLYIFVPITLYILAASTGAILLHEGLIKWNS